MSMEEATLTNPRLDFNILLNEAIFPLGRNTERILKKVSGAFLGSLVNKWGQWGCGEANLETSRSHDDLREETAGC